MKRLSVFSILLLFLSLSSFAQVTGKVIDAKTRHPLDYVMVFYKDKNIGEMTDEEGRFVIKEDSALTELTISSMGYVTKVITLDKFGKNKNMTIRLEPESKTLATITVSAKRGKYSRKNNPAVELMKKVIANKKTTDLYQKDYYQFTKYEKMTFSLNEFTERIFEEGEFKKFAFLKDHVERCPETGKLILPVIVQESVSENFYRKDPCTEKQLIKAQSDKGVNELINTGEIITTLLKDVFTDVNIYDNECRLLQFQFKSPIADNAISFYRYYLQDTIKIENDSVIDVGFLPNNQQDFGFSGHLYIMKDSTYQVRRVELNIPRRSDVNFVENMIIKQDLVPLPTGERVCQTTDMLIELKLASWIKKLMVQRTIRNFDFNFDEIPARVFKSIKGNVKTEANAKMQDDSYWSKYRQVELTKSESMMDGFLEKLKNIKGFKWFMFGLKALIENYIETASTTEKNKFDFGPINTIYSYNHYDKSRIRLSGFTTANLNPHFFLDGYVAYGFNHKQVYGMLKATYSFNKKAYLHREFPKNNIHIEYLNDITDPYKRYLTTDKDNMFMAIKTSKSTQYYHTREHKISYDREWENGLKFYCYASHLRQEAVDELFFQNLGTGTKDMTTGRWTPNQYDKRDNNMTITEFRVKLTFEPGATYINTKQRRLKINLDAPIYYIGHYTAVKGLLGGQFNSNITDMGVYKRWWVGTWGKIDFSADCGLQWNKVPFPLLIHPNANTSFIRQDYSFSLISNWEFLNDRWASVMAFWDLNGKIFNRIPLLKKLKWREMLGIKMLWGATTDKNNPYKSNFSDPDLWYFPGTFENGKYVSNTTIMDPKKPYIELSFGIHNIFKLVHIEYVHRLNYQDTLNGQKWGIRFTVKTTF